VRPRGDRHTAAALALAADQLPKAVDGPRVVVLYTAARDAGGPSADDLGATLLRSHALLFVVSTAADTGYWSQATARTGGFLAPATEGSAVPAFDQVSTMLRARYLVSIPTPGRLPAPVSLRVDTGDATLTGDAVVPAAAGPDRGRRGYLALAAAGVGVLAVAFGLLVYRWRRQTR